MTSAASTAAFTLAASVASATFALAVDLADRRSSSPGRVESTTSMHLPLRDPALERVLAATRWCIHSRVSTTMNPASAGEGDEEPESGAEVGAEQEVDRPAEEHDGRDHDEHAEDRRVPQPLGRTLAGERQQRTALQRPLVGHDLLDLCLGQHGAEVRHAPRRDAADAVALVGRRADADPGEQLGSPLGGGNWRSTSPSVRLGPKAPLPIGDGNGFASGLVGIEVRPAPRVAPRAVVLEQHLPVAGELHLLVPVDGGGEVRLRVGDRVLGRGALRGVVADARQRGERRLAPRPAPRGATSPTSRASSRVAGVSAAAMACALSLVVVMLST